MALSLLGWLLVINTFGALGITILSRYLLAFPTALTKWYNLKVGIIFVLTIVIFAYIITAYTFSYVFSPEKETIRQWSAAYNLEKFLIEPAFTIVPYSYLSNVCFFLLIILPFIGGLFIALLIFFIYLVKTKQSLTVAKLSRSLIVSSSVQILCTFILLLLPFSFIVLTWYFKIQNTANIICVINCIIASHSLMEFIATLYFIIPYRKFVLKLFERIKNFYNPIPLNIIWSNSQVTDIIH
uniref:G-protein coupled receptors family 1 profile domain-containing protein n=1 Tax=Panagrolaimus davidi TaxID=227884 RepID=A0A914P9U1_9BILA